MTFLIFAEFCTLISCRILRIDDVAILILLLADTYLGA